jgi:hypothetical protein
MLTNFKKIKIYKKQAMSNLDILKNLNDTLVKIYADDRIPMERKLDIITNLIASNFKFPIQVQTCLKVKFYSIRHGQEEYTIKSIRAEDISNASYTANNKQDFLKVVSKQLREFIEGLIFQFQEEGSDWRFDSIVSFHIRFWE